MKIKDQVNVMALAKKIAAKLLAVNDGRLHGNRMEIMRDVPHSDRNRYLGGRCVESMVAVIDEVLRKELGKEKR